VRSLASGRSSFAWRLRIGSWLAREAAPAYHRGMPLPPPLPDPLRDSAERQDYQEGWERFTRRQFWHAHESWERIWLHQKDPVRSFLQGLIQLTAAYFLLLGEAPGPGQKRLTRPLSSRFHGALRNFAKAEARLGEFPATYLDVDVAAVLQTIDHARRALHALGPERLTEFPQSLIAVGARVPL